MSERPPLSKLRVATGLIGAPIVAAAAMVLPSGVYWPFESSKLLVAVDTWLMMSAAGIPLALVTGLPLLVLFEAFGLRAFWHYALGGAAIGILISFVVAPFGGAYSPIVSVLMAIATGASALVFWAYAILDWPRYARWLLRSAQ